MDDRLADDVVHQERGDATVPVPVVEPGAPVDDEVLGDELLDRIADELDVRVRAQAVLLAVGARAHERDVEVHQAAGRGVESDRVLGQKERAHLAGVSRARPVALHRDDRVHHVESRGQGTVQSTSICAKRSSSGMRAWNSPLRIPGMQPNWFLTAPVMRVRP